MSVVAEPETRSLSELEADHPVVEALIRRELRASERAIDILRLDAAMNAAKDEVTAAIEREKRRAVNRRRRGEAIIDLKLTGAMFAPLEGLYSLGRREARAELQRLGYLPARRFAAAPRPRRRRKIELETTIVNGLTQLSRRLGQEWAEADLSGLSQSAIVSALYSVPGARNIAAAVVSPALADGLGATFEEDEDLVGGWEYTAVMDGGTCDVCEAADGLTFDTWAQISAFLPDGGPNPECLGGSRCRCRPVPAARP